MSTDPTKISAQPPPEQEQKKTPERMSKGEKMFNWLTYGSVAGVITYVLSLPMGYGLRYTNAGKALSQWSHGIGAKFGMRKEVAEDVMMATALMQGGNITLVPVKMMEDNKPELVHRLNCVLKDDASKNDLSEIEPIKQTWGSIIKSRIVAWSAVFASLRGTAMLIGPEKFEAFEKSFAKNMLCDPLGLPTHVNGVETRAYKIGRIGAIDLFATAAAASLLYIGSRIFGERKRQENGHAKAESPALPPETAVPEPENGQKPRFADKLNPQAHFTDRLSPMVENTPQLSL